MWPASAKSAVAIALAHKEDELELDYWENGVVSAGGRIMARIVDALAKWEERVEALKDILPVLAHRTV